MSATIYEFVKKLPEPTQAVSMIGEHAKAHLAYITAWQIFWLHLWGVK